MNKQPVGLTAFIKAHPVSAVGRFIHLILRSLFGVFWLAAGINKITKEWLTTDTLEQAFLQRLTELPPDSFAVFYLQTLAIPLSVPIAWVVTVGEIYVAIGLLFGVTTRLAAAASFFILFNFAIGGYYDASLIPFFLLSLLFMAYSSGHWLGFDRTLHRRYPVSKWFG